MAVTETINIAVTATTAQFERSLKKSGTLAVAFGSIVADAMRSAARAVPDLISEVQELRNELTDASTRTGLATRTLQGLRLAAEGSGQAFGELAGGLNQFPKRLADVARGGGEAKAAFAALGISATKADGSLRDTDEVFREILDSLRQVEDPGKRAALATEAFGEAGGKLLQAVGGGGLESFVALSEHFGADVGPQAAAAAAEWQRSTAELGTVLDGVKTSIVDTAGATQILSNFTVGLVGVLAGLGKAAEIVSDRLALLAIAPSAAAAKLAESLGFVTDQTRTTILAAEDLSRRVVTAGVTGAEMGETISDAIAAAGEEFIGFRSDTRQTGDALGALVPPVADLGKATKEAEEQAKALQIANQELSDAWRKAVESQLSDEQKLQIAQSERRAQTLEAGELTGRQAEAEATVAIQQMVLEEDLAAIREQAALARITGNEEAIAVIVEQEEAAAARLAELDAEKKQRAEDTRESVINATTQSIDAVGGFASDLLQEQIEFYASIGESGKDEARKLFAVQKALHLGTAIISSAAAITLAAASAPPPANVPAIVAATVLGAVQVAAIAAQQPSFHAGSRASDLAPDETMARITRREAVVTSQGAQAMAAANAGIGGLGGSMTIQIGHDFFDAVMKDANRPGSQFRRAMGRRPVGHSGRGGK